MVELFTVHNMRQSDRGKPGRYYLGVNQVRLLDICFAISH